MVNVFIDKQTGDEIVSDAYALLPPFELKETELVSFEACSRYVRKGAEDFGISMNVDEDAAEGATGDGGDNAGERVLDLVDSFKLTKMEMTKKEFQGMFAAYMKTLMEKVEADKLPAWKASISALFKKMQAEFDNAEIYVSENGINSDTPMPIYAYWKGEEEAPRFIYLKDSLKEVKY